MTFAFAGFDQEGTFRVFSYESLPREAGRGLFVVRADLSLARQHGITLQELPVLCRKVLEGQATLESGASLTYSGAEMSVYAKSRDLAAQRHPVRRPVAPRRNIVTADAKG